MSEIKRNGYGRIFQISGEKYVPCPACHGNGYVGDEGTAAADCGYCDSQGEVPKQSADEWPCK